MTVYTLRMAGAGRASSPTAKPRHVYTVTELAREVKGLLEQAFPIVWRIAMITSPLLAISSSSIVSSVAGSIVTVLPSTYVRTAYASKDVRIVTPAFTSWPSSAGAKGARHSGCPVLLYPQHP